MRKILLILFINVLIINFIKAQCTAPSFDVDLSAQTDTTWVLSDETRGGMCCGSSNCITFNVTINPGTDLISFDVTNPSPSGSAYYQVNCGAPVSIGTPLCAVGLASPFTITYCKPGGDSPDYIISAGTVVHASDDISIRIVGCTDTLFVDNADLSSIEWTSIYPGNEGDYDSYLSCTSGCNSTLVTPDVNPPAYVDYQVSANPNIPCGSYTRDTVRVYFVPHMEGWITPDAAVICASSGDVLTLTGNASGGALPYHFSWSSGPNSQSINVNSAGTYIVTITDHTNCPPLEITKTIESQPSASFSYSDTTFCLNDADQTVTFVNNGQAGTFTTSPAGLSFVSDTTGEIDLATSIAGDYTVTNTIDPTGVCPGAVDSFSIALNPFPEITSSDTDTICSGSTLNLPITSTVSATYSWVASDNPNVSGESLSMQTTSTINNTLVNNTDSNQIVTYTVVPTSSLTGACKGDTQIVSITVVPIDDASFSYSSSTNCQTGANPTTTITGLPGGTFSSTAGLVFVSTSTGEIDLLSSTVGSYVVTYTTNGTCPSSEDFPITITDAPSAVFTYIETPYCQNESNPLPTYDSGAGGGTFSSTVGLSLNSLTGVVDLANSTPGSYVVTNTIPASGGCATATDTANITITELQVTDFAFSGTPYCQNASNPLPTYIGDGMPGLFTSDAGLSIDVFSGEIDLASSTAGTYTVVNTIDPHDGCPIDTTSAIVTVTALPTADFSYGGSPYCQDGTNPLPTLGVGATSGTFSASSVYLNINSSSGLIDLSGSNDGTFLVTNTVAAVAGCPSVSASSSITITALPVASLIYSTTPYCQNETNPTPTLDAGGTNGIYTSFPAGLEVDSFAGTVNLSASISGTYTVYNTIAAAGGCEEVVDSTDITITALPTADISYAGTPFCSSDSSSEIVTLSGSSGGYYSSLPAGLTIDTASGDITPDASTIGNYTVVYVIPAAGGCGQVSDSTDIMITQLPSATIDYSGSPYCNFASPASVIFTGNTSGTYSTQAGLTINSMTGDITPVSSVPGSYEVLYTIPAANGCGEVIVTDSVTINEMPTAFSSSNGILCYGGSTDVLVTATGGTSPYTGDSTFTEFAGTYSYIVTDANGCSDTTNITITQPDSLIASSFATPILCNGEISTVTVTETGGTAPFSGDGTYYEVAGSYSYTVTDTNGCTSTTDILISEPMALTSFVNTTVAGCGLSDGSATVMANGGTGTLTYEWPSLNTDSIETGLAFGTYVVTITDANGCTLTDTANVLNSNAPTVSYTQTDVLCYGLSTGSINLTVSGGTGSYTYDWNSGTYTSEDLDSLSAGTYNYIVTDSSNCQASGMITITEPSLLTTGIGNITMPKCSYSNDGQAVVVPGGGTTPYSFLWSDGDGTNSDTITTMYGYMYYYVTVTDNNGCSTVDSVYLTTPDTLTLTTFVSDAICMANNGSASVTVSGGVGGYSYFWNDTTALTNDSITGLAPGTYTLMVYDSNLCTIDTIIQIMQIPSSMTSSLSSQDITCYGYDNGLLIASAQGGTGPYTYAWSNSENTASVSNLPVGNYTVTVSDIYGCTTTASGSISQPPAIAISDTVYVDGNNFGNIDLTVSGGVSPYNFIWSNDEISEDLYGLGNGIYIITVTDMNSCVSVDSISVAVHETNIVIPTIITPNNDGYNDDFQILNIQYYSNISVEIYGRWGDLLFKFKGMGNEYNDKSNRWDGTFKGHDLPMGTYVYIIFIDNVLYKGIISITR